MGQLTTQETVTFTKKRWDCDVGGELLLEGVKPKSCFVCGRDMCPFGHSRPVSLPSGTPSLLFCLFCYELYVNEYRSEVSHLWDVYERQQRGVFERLKSASLAKARITNETHQSL